jgi:hypothetical protein
VVGPREQALDEEPCRRPDRLGGGLERLGREAGRGAVVRGPVLVQGDDGAPTARLLARMSRDPDPIMKDADEGRGAVDVDPLADQAGRHRVGHALNADVVVRRDFEA